MNKQEILDWFKGNQKQVNLHHVGHASGCYESLKKALRGECELPNKHVDPLNKSIKLIREGQQINNQNLKKMNNQKAVFGNFTLQKIDEQLNKGKRHIMLPFYFGSMPDVYSADVQYTNNSRLALDGFDHDEIEMRDQFFDFLENGNIYRRYRDEYEIHIYDGDPGAGVEALYPVEGNEVYFFLVHDAEKEEEMKMLEENNNENS